MNTNLERNIVYDYLMMDISFDAKIQLILGLDSTNSLGFFEILYLMPIKIHKQFF